MSIALVEAGKNTRNAAGDRPTLSYSAFHNSRCILSTVSTALLFHK